MKRLITLFILKLIIIKCTDGDNNQLSCPQSRGFIATEGHALIGHVISTYTVNLFPECQELCTQAPRCLSYNYEYKSTSSNHVCEINDATDKMCPGSLVRKPGFKYYEDKDSTCTKQCPPTADVEEKNFQVTFSRKSKEDYVRFDLQRCVPPLTAFTICLWLKVADKEQSGCPFSYALPHEENEIFLMDYKSLRLYIAGEKRYMNIAVNNGTWRHVCTTWENTAGSWNLYIDGALLVTGTDLKTGHVIDNNGIFILGQDQDNYGGEFQLYQSFIGQMYGVNMWNRVLTADEISHMSGNCSYGVGNYLRWSDFKNGLRGNVSKTSPPACLP
ncbi:serum amyloid P-component-like [Oculina patagonica]